MAYIGKTPTSGDFVLLDSITTSATASYTMQKNSVNFEPQSANHMILSLNGTIQAPVSSFTVSGSTLTFASALTSSDVIDFILVLGNVNDVGTATTVVDSAITKNKLNLISESSSAGLTVKGDGSSENGTIQMNCSQNTHGIKLSSPDHSAGQSYELIFPTGNVTADKFLKVASVSGSGTTGIGQLSFADAGGTLVKVGDVRTNSAAGSHSLTGIFSDTYDKYFFSLSTFPDVSNNAIQFRFLDSSNNDVSTGYYGASFGRDQSGNSVSHSHNGHDNITLSNGHSNARAFQCQGYIVGPTSGIANNKQVMWQSAQWDNVNVFRTQVGGYTNVSSTDYTGMKIKSNSNNLVGISLQVYGIVDTKHYNGS
tara:strand:+ start:1040 stop:2143 length:1104 start_codon:yes stop_codon:yes gene_type:complete